MCGSITIFYGGVINPSHIDSFSALPRCVLCVDTEGNIAWIIDDVEPQHLQEQLAMRGLVDPEIIILKDGEFIIPGFIDTHTVSENLECKLWSHCTTQACTSISEHGDVSYLQVQPPKSLTYPRGGQFQLLDWLEMVTFPTEAKFAEADFARRTYRSVIRRTLDAGVCLSFYVQPA